MKKSVTVIDEKTGERSSKLIDMTPQEIAARVVAVTPSDVKSEMRVRLAAGFMFNGSRYDVDLKSLAAIAAVANVANAAIMQGVARKDYLWLDKSRKFTWVDADNNTVPQDAQDMVDMLDAAVKFVSGLSQSARALKDLTVIPQDYRDDRHWA